MKTYTTVAAVATAAILGAGAFALPAAASASTTTHTLKFTAEKKSSVSLTRLMGSSDSAMPGALAVAGGHPAFRGWGAAS
jgi:hypothetical protein